MGQIAGAAIGAAFQFHKVQLKEVTYSTIGLIRKFQFHKVQLKDRIAVSGGTYKDVSIP